MSLAFSLMLAGIMFLLLALELELVTSFRANTIHFITCPGQVSGWRNELLYHILSSCLSVLSCRKSITAAFFLLCSFFLSFCFDNVYLAGC